MKLIFFKYRIGTSASAGTWLIEMLPSDMGQTLKERINEIVDDRSWSEHFRGIEYKQISPSKLNKKQRRAFIDRQITKILREQDILHSLW